MILTNNGFHCCVHNIEKNPEQLTLKSTNNVIFIRGEFFVKNNIKYMKSVTWTILCGENNAHCLIVSHNLNNRMI